MKLILTIQKAPGSVVVHETSKEFGSEGGTIGRDPENTWALADPERFLSKVHCEIVYESGQYYIIDRSTNGIFYNWSAEPVAKGGRMPVRDNDRFILGDYEFAASMDDDIVVGWDDDPSVVVPPDKPAAPSATKPGGVDRSFVNALGLTSDDLADSEVARINHLAGRIFREMIKGLMLVLASRNAIKTEFRIKVTSVQPKENNPLKFSPGVDDALEIMFLKHRDAYLEPIEAVRDGFNSIAEHQLAVLAGIRKAFKGLVERFEPDLLEQRFAKHHKSGMLPASHKAKNWESFVAYYDELTGDSDNFFRSLYGDEFVRAYEEQMEALSVTGKAKDSGGRQ